MPSRTTIFTDSEYYHIYNRGSSKQIIFHDIQDTRYFQSLLFLMNREGRVKKGNIVDIYDFAHKEKPLVSVGAYCLMPNHFHILLKQETDKGITVFMQKVSTGYAMYYNKKYKHTGTIFEGRFKAKHSNDDRYLKYLFAYIHLNPLKIINSEWKKEKNLNSKKYLEFLEKYSGSSYLDYKGIMREEGVIINKEAFPNYFSTKESFQKDLFSWLLLTS